MGGVVWKLLGMLSARSWRTLSVLREAVLRVRIGMLLWRWRSNLLVVLVYNARGPRLLEVVRRWGTLLRAVGRVFLVIPRDRDTRFLFVRLSMSHLGRWELCPGWDIFQVQVRIPQEAFLAITGRDAFWSMQCETPAVTLYSNSNVCLQVRSS